jgi:hypothetical protein
MICALVKLNFSFDVGRCLKRIASLYASGIKNTTEDTIPQPHKSFFDLTASESRAPAEFLVDLPTAHHELALSCFRIMRDELHFNMGGFDSPQLDNDDAPSRVPAHVIYACSSVAYHMQGSGKVFVDEISDWAKESLLFWLEVMGLSGNIDYKVSQPKAVLETFKTNTKVIQRYFLFFTNAYCSLTG